MAMRRTSLSPGEEEEMVAMVLNLTHYIYLQFVCLARLHQDQATTCIPVHPLPDGPCGQGLCSGPSQLEVEGHTPHQGSDE